MSVASRARSATAGDGGGTGVARARVRTRAGRWLVVRGSVLGDGPESRVAILLEAARPPELAPLIADTYGFTERERKITELVAQGFPTSGIATRLHLSAYTVQDHLKSIFNKSGTGSRGDLVARLFFDHYAPRLTAQAPHDTPG
jgi:DNA-binding CsgD family transcriptional regulator